MAPLAKLVGTATAKVADLTPTPLARFYTTIPKAIINVKRETLISTAASVLEDIADEDHTNHLTKRVKSVKQLIKERIIREIKKAIKNWILEHKWIFIVFIIFWTVLILGSISLCGHCIKFCCCCITRAPKNRRDGGISYRCVRTCYGEHFAEKLGNNKEQLALAGINYVDTTYLGRCCGRRPLPETAAEIKAMPFCGRGGGRKKKNPAPTVEYPPVDHLPVERIEYPESAYQEGGNPAFEYPADAYVEKEMVQRYR